MKILTTIPSADYLYSVGIYFLAHHPSKKKYKPYRVYVETKHGYIHAGNFHTQNEGMKYINILIK